MSDLELKCLALYEAWARGPIGPENGSDELTALFRVLVALYPDECAEAFKR